MHKEIRICGYGGQGIVLSGVILGEAAVMAGHEAVQTQSYGPESRGGAARSEVVIASEPIDYPRVTAADVTVALSQPAYDRYVAGHEGGLVVVDRDLVQANGVQALHFTKTAERVGHKIVTNIVMLGYLGSILGLIPDDVFEAAVIRNVPPGTESMNRAAIQAGRELFQLEIEGRVS
ncbi:MAG: 2-oxoacid:acceptor oxidoreductase family protein [Candidatus Eiseniibacteriota bacterium]|jgi:2-oxoglutarate ferredoxin oxidoreductase subunit gamma